MFYKYYYTHNICNELSREYGFTINYPVKFYTPFNTLKLYGLDFRALRISGFVLSICIPEYRGCAPVMRPMVVASGDWYGKDAFGPLRIAKSFSNPEFVRTFKSPFISDMPPLGVYPVPATALDRFSLFLWLYSAS